MISSGAWPSRRFQIAVIVILALGAAATAFLPSRNREQRAEQLYEDSWFDGLWSLSRDSELQEGRDNAIRKLNAALELSPGNLLYEQALVWHATKDQLPKLLKERNLGLDAQTLAYGIIYAPTPNYMADSTLPASEIVKRELAKTEELKKHDPQNALPCYFRAIVLKRAGRLDEALTEVKAGNRCGMTRLYVPAVSKRILNSAVAVSVYGDFSQWAGMRDLARGMVDLSNKRLMAHDVTGACEALEECCRMGVNISSCQPHLMTPHFVGAAMYYIGWASLEPIYKDFGMKDKLPIFKRVYAELANQKDYMNSTTSGDGMDFMFYRMFAAAIIPVTLSVAILLSVFMLLCQALSLLAFRKTLRGIRESLKSTPWGEGWLARVLLLIYTPVFVLTILELLLIHSLPSFRTNPILFDVVPIIPVSCAWIVFIALIVRLSRRRYYEHTQPGMPIPRFWSKWPKELQLWTVRNLLPAYAAQAAFLCCGIFLTIILYKPIMGFQPWQITRIQTVGMSRELSRMTKMCVDLQKAIPFEWQQRLPL